LKPGKARTALDGHTLIHLGEVALGVVRERVAFDDEVGADGCARDESCA
jgi:hypothetical protein